jgi:hypothetical protein
MVSCTRFCREISYRLFGNGWTDWSNAQPSRLFAKKRSQKDDNLRFKRLASCLLVVLCVAATPKPSPKPSPKPPANALRINKDGTYTDKGVWLYGNAPDKYSYGPEVIGTNELLVMPEPSPPTGSAVAGVVVIRHAFDMLGYPMHIALVEKLFAAGYQVPISASQSGELWKYSYGDPIAAENLTTGGTRPPFKSFGPYPANAIPMDKAPEPEIQAAFTFAKNAMNQISNLPASQKDLSNYGALFIDDGTTVWVEFGPRFGVNETPHLGCQTQLGRDMVFGYNKTQTNAKGSVGKFLQCF